MRPSSDGWYRVVTVQNDGKCRGKMAAAGVTQYKRDTAGRNKTSVSLWHNRLGHANTKVADTLLNDDNCRIKKQDKPKDVRCETCVRAMHAKSPSKKN